MTIAELQEIINLNIDAAQAGCLQSQGQVVEAQAELERLEAKEREENTNFSILRWGNGGRLVKPKNYDKVKRHRSDSTQT